MLFQNGGLLLLLTPNFSIIFDLAMIGGGKIHSRKNLLLSDFSKKILPEPSAVGQSLTFIINQPTGRIYCRGCLQNFDSNNSFHFQILTNLDSTYNSSR